VEVTVAELPAGWEGRSLLDIVELHDNRRIPLNAKQREEKQGPFPYYGANGQVDSIDEYIFEGNYILLAEDGGHFDDNSKKVAYEVTGKFWVNNHAHVLSPRNDTLLRFLTYRLNSIDWMHYVGGSTRLKLTQEGLRKVVFPLPPLAEQQRIVARLDAMLGHLQRARCELQGVAALAEQAREAIVKASFFEPMTTSNFSKAKLKNIIDAIRTGPFGSSLHKSDYVANGIPVINPMHINGGKITPDPGTTISEVKADELREFKLKVDDIIIARRGVMGRCAVVTKNEANWICGTGSIIISPKESINSAYLQLFLSSKPVIEILEAAAVGSTMVNLNQSILLDIDLYVPPLVEQHTIVARIEAAFGRIAAMEAEAARGLALIERLEQATLAQAFRGEL
jgi:type I restriction enzyme, S subunit